jgi:hypothetical protein
VGIRAKRHLARPVGGAARALGKRSALIDVRGRCSRGAGLTQITTDCPVTAPPSFPFLHFSCLCHLPRAAPRAERFLHAPRGITKADGNGSQDADRLASSATA